MVANSRKKQSPGTHKSLTAEFISMEAPFRVVLNWILSPNTEFRARQKACTRHQHTVGNIWSFIVPFPACIIEQDLVVN